MLLQVGDGSFAFSFRYKAGEEGKPDAKPIGVTGKFTPDITFEYDDQGRLSKFSGGWVVWRPDGLLLRAGTHHILYEGDPIYVPPTCCIIL